MSRDITGLFQSFQSSATVLDPAANPSLFKSTLVIIVKVSSNHAALVLIIRSPKIRWNLQDVVDSDKKEIMKEYGTSPRGVASC